MEETDLIGLKPIFVEECCQILIADDEKLHALWQPINGPEITLTRDELRVLSFLNKEEHGQSPSVNKVAKAFGASSTYGRSG